MSDTVSQIEQLPPLPSRPEDAHKGTFGTLLILGGSTEMIGAPMLAARSAYRAGCGLVQVAMPQSVLAAALSALPEAIGLGLHEDDQDVQRLRRALEKPDAVVAGPGLGQEKAADALLDSLLSSDKPLVLDADALNLLAARERWEKREAPTILTPHPGEMKRLLKHLPQHEVPSDNAGRIDICLSAARRLGVVLVLKGHRTVVSDGRCFYVNQTGDNSLAKAGSGDVLSGLIGSLLAQGANAFDAAYLGVHYHGQAGELAGDELGNRSVLAHDVAERVGRVMDEGSNDPPA